MEGKSGLSPSSKKSFGFLSEELKKWLQGFKGWRRRLSDPNRSHRGEDFGRRRGKPLFATVPPPTRRDPVFEDPSSPESPLETDRTTLTGEDFGRRRGKPLFATVPPPTRRAPPTSEYGAANQTGETVFSPEVSSEAGHLSYRFRCPSSGTFHCSYTGLVFVMVKEAEPGYRIVQWDEALLQKSGRTPAGPLYDIECPEGAVCELHLPHCEPDNADLSQSLSALSVAHISDTGLSLIEPQRITESHVVISVSSLSPFGLARSLYDEEPFAVSAKVLLFRTPRKKRAKIVTVNMFLLPRNIPTVEVERNQRSTTEYIDAPTRCQLVINKYYSVDCPSAEVVQPERAQFEIDKYPDYSPLFQLLLDAESSTVSITVREEGSSEGKVVWRLQLNLTDCVVLDSALQKMEKPQPGLGTVAANDPSRPGLTVEDLLLRVLKELVQTQDKPELETFVFHLKVLHPDLPRADLVGASRTEIVQVLVQKLGHGANAIGATLRILKHMGKNLLADELSRASGFQG